jgi:hypothetical protein
MHQCGCGSTEFRLDSLEWKGLDGVTQREEQRICCNCGSSFISRTTVNRRPMSWQERYIHDTDMSQKPNRPSGQLR